MEVPGRRPGKGSEKASDAAFNIYCQPCHKKGKQLSAHGYCQTCAEYLCDTCFNIHTIPTPSQHHVLLDKSNMPQPAVQPSVQASKCTVVCPTHPDKVIEFFCPVHDGIVCGVCAVLSHKPCKVDYIPDIAQNYKSNPNYTSLKDTIDQLEKDVDECLNIAAVNGKASKESSDKAIDKIKQFRTEINAYLDKKESEILLVAKKMLTEDADLQKKIETDCNGMKYEITNIKTKLTKLENESSDLFITVKQVENHIRDLQVLINADQRNKASCYSFECEQAIESLLSSQCPLGKVNKVHQQQEAKSYAKIDTLKKNMNSATATISRLADLNVKSSKDKGDCSITGATLLSPTRMLVADWKNQTVKCIDITNNTVTSCLQLSSEPWDITSLPSHQAAITLLQNQQIQLISTSGDLSPISTIAVKGQCRGIDSTNDKIIVSYISPRKVEVMDHHGGVLQSIINDVDGQPLFKFPQYVAVSREEGQEIIFVSDFTTNTITKLSLDGSVLLTYTDDHLSRPYGLTVTGDGQVIICGRQSHNVQLVCGKTGKKTRTLLTGTDGIEYPRSVCYCPVQHKLYVGSSAMKVYKLN